MQNNKPFKIPENIIINIFFFVGILACSFVAFLLYGAFDEIWDGYNLFLPLAIMFSVFMLPGLIMILLAVMKQKRFSKILLFSLAAFFIIVTPLSIITIGTPKSPWIIAYTSVDQKFAVKTWYHDETDQTAFEIVNARDGWGVEGFSSEKGFNKYKITETTSSLVVTFYDAENKQIDYYEFDMNSFNTETREWVVK